MTATTTPTASPLNLQSLKDAFHSMVNAEGNADSPGGNLLAKATTYAKQNPLRSLALGFGALMLLKRVGGTKLTGATAVSGLGFLAKTLLANRARA